MIDIDHYFAAVLAGNGLNLKKAFDWFLLKNKNVKEYASKWFILFHGIEFFIILILAWYFTDGWISMLFLYILIGSIFHMILDITDLVRNGHPLYFKLSRIYTCYKNSKLKRVSIKTKTFKYQGYMICSYKIANMYTRKWL